MDTVFWRYHTPIHIKLPLQIAFICNNLFGAFNLLLAISKLIIHFKLFKFPEFWSNFMQSANDSAWAYLIVGFLGIFLAINFTETKKPTFATGLTICQIAYIIYSMSVAPSQVASEPSTVMLSVRLLPIYIILVIISAISVGMSFYYQKFKDSIVSDKVTVDPYGLQKDSELTSESVNTYYNSQQYNVNDNQKISIPDSYKHNNDLFE